MGDVTTNALRGIVKTLGDVVVPAIPADDPLALQELKMAIRYLNFARERIDHLHARARFELTFHAGMAAACLEKLGAEEPVGSRDLATLHDRAVSLLARPEAAIREIRDLSREIATRISALLGEVRDSGRLAAIERAVVDASAEIAAFDRSWYAPMKLERFPDEVRPLNSFIPI